MRSSCLCCVTLFLWIMYMCVKLKWRSGRQREGPGNLKEPCPLLTSESQRNLKLTERLKTYRNDWIFCHQSVSIFSSDLWWQTVMWQILCTVSMCVCVCDCSQAEGDRAGSRAGQCVAAWRRVGSACGGSSGSCCPRDDPAAGCHANSTLWGIWARGRQSNRKSLWGGET